MRRTEAALALALAAFCAGCSKSSSTADSLWWPDFRPLPDARPPDRYLPDLPLACADCWLAFAGGDGYDQAADIAVDGSGNALIVGAVSSKKVSFGSIAVTSPSLEGFSFAAKLDPQGNFLWATPLDGAVAAVAARPDGHCVVAGTQVTRLDGSGAIVWSIPIGGAEGATMLGDIATDGAGNSYVAGRIVGTATLGGLTVSSPSQESPSILVAKLDGAGKALWAVTAGRPVAALPAIAVDASGHAHVTGQLCGTGSFGATTLVSKGGCGSFVAKLDSSGTFLWAVAAGGSEPAPSPMEAGFGIAVDGSGNSYVTGAFAKTGSFGSITLPSATSANLIVAKLDPAGTFLWARTAQQSTSGLSPVAIVGRSIAVDGAGQAHVTGELTGPATFGTTWVAGGTGLFWTKLDADGRFVQVMSPGGHGGPDFATGLGIAVDAHGVDHIAGRFSGTVSFGALTRTAHNPSSNNTDAFVWKLHAPGP